ncbi:MAG: nicotinate (nicotinamide) nucleotide adenylyltransferase [Muribaculaceae bacterium]|nr:nicotinate (nicotinamide) nucleotide adenylyltransferase [Muribaculaceae bacterium]
MYIALYPGSFDPPHCGHAMVASFVAQWGRVDEVWVMPSGINPLKIENSPKAGDAGRLEMCRLAMEGIPGVRVSDFELHLPRPSFTYRTLIALKDAYPEHRFRLVIGGDNWHVFARWRNSEEIIREFGLIIYPRPGFYIDPARLPENVTLLPEAPLMLLSSTFVREAIASGKSPLGFISKEVSAYIGAHSLYHNI